MSASDISAAKRKHSTGMRRPPPTTNAKECLEQLWQHMELSLRNRVEAKTGRSTALELTKLSNLMSHAGLAHSSKPRTPVSASRIRRLEGGIVIPPEQRSSLREVFIFYCSWAEKHNYLYMSRSQFLRCCRDTMLMGGDLDAVALSLLFDKVHTSSRDPDAGVRFTMSDWLSALMVIATRVYPHLPVQEAWDKVVGEHVLMFGGRSTTGHDWLAPIMLQGDVVEALGAARAKLRPVFHFYANEQQFGPVRPDSRQQQAGGLTAAGARASPTAASTPAAPFRPLSPGTLDMGAPTLLSHRTSLNPAGSLPSPRVHRLSSGPGCLPSLIGGNDGGGGIASMPSGQLGAGLDGPQSSLLPTSSLEGPGGVGGGGGGGLLGALGPGTGQRTALGSLPPAANPLAAGIPVGSGPLTSIERFQAVNAARSQMPLLIFMRFLQDFDILPKYVSKAQATLAFRAARFGLGHDNSEGADIGRIDFDEFMEAVGRCALIAFNFQLPKEVQYTMAFKDSYQQGAKALWSSVAREHLSEALTFPDEVAVPAAELEEALGNEDAPHYDQRLPSHWGGGEGDGHGAGGHDGAQSTWGGARSTKSRAGGIFRSARSLAQFRTKVRIPSPGDGDRGGGDGGGAEVLAVHDEVDVLPDERPPHLSCYTPDWVGRPSMPLGETARLSRRRVDPALASGVYVGSDVGLPPIYKERAEDMIQARAMREQCVEALRMVYVAQRRVARRQKLRAAAEQRVTLQAACHQLLGGRRAWTSSPVPSA